MPAWDISDEERWMYEMAGARYPELKPTRVISFGGSGGNHGEDDLADLDRLVEEVRTGALRPGSIEESSATTEIAEPGLTQPGPPTGETESDWVADELAMVIPEPRWTKDAYQAHLRIRDNRTLIRRFSQRVYPLAWSSHSGSLPMGEKFPFLHTAINNSSSKGSSKEVDKKNKKNGGSGSFSPHRDEISLGIPGALTATLPAWKKLPAANKRSSGLQELITGLRFASIAFESDLSLQQWSNQRPGQDIACLSIDIKGDAANRFLEGENGNVGAALHRGLLRRLERDLGGVAAAVLWVRPTDSPPGVVRIFMIVRSTNNGRAHDLELVDRSNRYYRSLVKHGVKFSDDGIPLTATDLDLASYLGQSVDDYLDDDPSCTLTEEIEVQEYSPESGFVSNTEIAFRAARSHARWSAFTARFGLPVWFDATFVRRLQDYFVYSPQHVRERQRLKAKNKKAKELHYKFSPLDTTNLTRFNLIELPLPSINLYRGSPAQFAALAFRSGEVLGDYCDSRHKAGRAKELYERLRAKVAK